MATPECIDTIGKPHDDLDHDMLPVLSLNNVMTALRNWVKDVRKRLAVLAGPHIGDLDPNDYDFEVKFNQRMTDWDIDRLA